MCTIALILSGLASIPFTDIRHPSTFPLYTPNTHFSGLSSIRLHACLRRSRLDHLFVLFSFYLPPRCRQLK
jgi:hypothetical protein